MYIGGTTPRLNGVNQPILDNLIGFKGEFKEEQKDQVLAVLAEDKSLPIMLTGFSQGGMDAQNLADELDGLGYNVKGVVAFGSPIVQPTPKPYPVAYLRDHLATRSADYSETASP